MNKQKPQWTRIATATLLAALVFTGSPAKAEVKSSEESAALDELTIDNDGKMVLNGSELTERKGPATFVYLEVEKTTPSIEGSTALTLRPIEYRIQNADGSFSTQIVKGAPKTFLYDIGMKLYDAEGALTNDPQLAYRVLMDAPGDGDRMAFDVIWNECDGNITGNYVGYKCSKKRGMSDEYAAYLKENILPCVTAGLANVGGGTATKVHIIHDGTVADENHSGSSLHAAGRAVDIMSMQVTSDKGTAEFKFQDTSSNPQGKNRKFYEGVRACWGKLQAKRKCPGRNSGPVGTIGWEDGKHRGHHLHMSLPFCPNNRGYFITGK